jgi:diguanylate cyclase (GGDEF)-like protein
MSESKQTTPSPEDVPKGDPPWDIGGDPRLAATVLDISNEVFSTLDVKEVLNRIVKLLAGMVRVAGCSIVKVDERRQVGQVMATFESPEVGDLRIDLRKYPEVTAAVKERRPILVQDVALDPRMEDCRKVLLDLGIRSLLVMPLFNPERGDDEVVGALYIRVSRREGPFSESEIRICRVVANMAAMATKNAFLFSRVGEERRHLEKLAVTDELTRLYNYRFFYRRIKEEFKRAFRYHLPMALLMLDVDDFRRVNALYGHPRGNIVLQEVARLIQRCIRETDISARYGGEEFAVILPHTEADNAFALAHRIRDMVRKSRYPGLPEGQRITVSVGIATYPHRGVRSVGELIGLADKGLYEAKIRGKDTVVCL